MSFLGLFSLLTSNSTSVNNHTQDGVALACLSPHISTLVDPGVRQTLTETSTSRPLSATHPTLKPTLTKKQLGCTRHQTSISPCRILGPENSTIAPREALVTAGSHARARDDTAPNTRSSVSSTTGSGWTASMMGVPNVWEMLSMMKLTTPRPPLKHQNKVQVRRRQRNRPRGNTAECSVVSRFCLTSTASRGLKR